MGPMTFPDRPISVPCYIYLLLSYFLKRIDFFSFYKERITPVGNGCFRRPFGAAHFSIKFVEIRKNALGTHDNVFLSRYLFFCKNKIFSFYFFGSLNSL